jgi:lysozyme family protein
VAAAAKAGTAQAVCAERLAFCQRLKTWPVFGKGWTARINDITKKVRAMAKAQPHVEEKSIFDEVLDTIDWTRHPEETARQAPPPAAPTLKGQSGYILAAIIAAVAALNNIDGAEWARTIQDPSGHLPMIATAIAIAIANAVLPAWVKWLLPAAPKLRA